MPINSIMLVGIALIVLGVVALAYQGITYTSRETVIDICPIHATADRPSIATPSVAAVMRTIAANRDPRRSMLNVRPAISAISVVAIPVTT